MKKLTKQQALEMFSESWNDAVKENPEIRGDVIMKREDWNNFTDMLCKDGQITGKQYETWSNPF